ncbi:MAG: disulfide bond formation protein B [Paracoccus sp. (in: a-proteobacteria)]|uniref:disulfide bond formation protein B n=1 Tax=Paracoccus sp. TaxID=267 RepID=UPI0026E0EAF4|nr:disulfide bond formation protein B [Paracoccus sp. (in: a-proteobacteria)]MDO5614236.1 disulfide bond formation protein B [Paracoccus sp. (in: a-proteobacteria)]
MRYPQTLSLLAAAGSAALLLGAFGFQLAGYAPCEMCIWQRWPHAIAIAIGAAIWWAGWRRALAWLGVLAALAATGLAVWHAGIELGIFRGVTACTGGVGDLTALSTADLMNRLQAAPVVRCDEVAWSLLGISMAGWNAIISAGLTGIWLASARARHPATA